MRIFFGVAVSMMLTVHYSISSRVQIRRALADKCKQMEYTLVDFMGTEHFVRCIPVQKKCLKKQNPSETFYKT